MVMRNRVTEGQVDRYVLLMRCSDLTFREAAQMVGISQYRAKEINKLFPEDWRTTRANRLRLRTGAETSNWRGGESVVNGYRTVLRPEWYTGNPSWGHAYEHHVVYCEANGLTAIPDGYVVHHINEDKGDNRIDNLEMMPRKEHDCLHAPFRRLGKGLKR